MLTPSRLPVDVAQGLFCLVDSLLYPSAPKLGLGPRKDKRRETGWRGMLECALGVGGSGDHRAHSREAIPQTLSCLFQLRNPRMILVLFTQRLFTSHHPPTHDSWSSRMGFTGVGNSTYLHGGSLGGHMCVHRKGVRRAMHTRRRLVFSLGKILAWYDFLVFLSSRPVGKKANHSSVFLLLVKYLSVEILYLYLYLYIRILIFEVSIV